MYEVRLYSIQRAMAMKRCQLKRYNFQIKNNEIRTAKNRI